MSDEIESTAARLPHPIALPLVEYARENDTYTRLHRLCDTTEMCLRFLAATALMEIEHSKGIGNASKSLRNTLADNIAKPSFTNWTVILKAALDELDQERHQDGVFGKDCHDLANALLDLVEGDASTGSRETAILPLRASLMQEERFSEDESRHLLEDTGHQKRFENFLTLASAALGARELIGLTAPGEGCLLRGAPAEGEFFEQVDVPETLDEPPGTILLRRTGETRFLALTPLQIFGPVARRTNDGSGRTEEQIGKDIAQVYSRSGDHLLQFTVMHDGVGSSDASLLLQANFEALFPLSDWRRDDDRIEEQQQGESERAIFLREAAKPFRFGEITQALLKEPFVGRDSELAQILDWLDMREQGCGVVFGRPGMGKTALAVRLSAKLKKERKNWLCLQHVFKADDDQLSSARAFITGVLLQLEELGIPVPALELDLNPSDLLQAFRRALVEVAEAFQDAAAGTKVNGKHYDRLMLLLDGLDELPAWDCRLILDLLNGPGTRGVVWLVSARPKLEILQGLPESQPDIEWIFGENGLRELDRRAVREYLLENLERERYSLLKEEADRDRFLGALTTEARSLPLYLHLLVEELRAGRGKEFLEHPEKLPGDLAAYYDHLLRDMSLDAANKILPDILAILAHARTPLPEATLENLLDDHDLRDDREWPQAFSRSLRLGHVLLKPGYVWEGESGHGLYHQSFRDYLLENEEKVGFPLAPVIRKARRRIEHLCRHWKDCAEGSYSRAYALRHGVMHFIDAGGWNDVIGNTAEPGMLTDLNLIEAKCAEGLTSELAEDYLSASLALPELMEEAAHREETRQLCRTYAFEMLEYARSSTTLDAPAEGSPLPKPPPVVGQWAIDFDQQQEAGLTSPRADRLQRFSSFFSRNRHLIEVDPAQTAPLAFNHAASGVVSEQGQNILERVAGIWLRRDLRPHEPPLHPLGLATLEGHREEIIALTANATFTRALSGGGDRVLRLWNLESGQCLADLVGHTGSVLAVTADTPFSRALSGGGDKTLRMWNLESGDCIAVIEGHQKRVTSLATNAAFSHAVSGSADTSLRVWDLKTQKCEAVLEGHSDTVTAVSVDAAFTKALSASHDKSLRLWDLKTGQCLAVLKGHLRGITSIATDPAFTRAISASGDKQLRVWDLASGQCTAILDGHRTSVEAIAVNPSFTHALSASWGKRIRLWSLQTGQCLTTLDGHRRWVSALTINATFSRAISGGGDGDVRVWDLEKGRPFGGDSRLPGELNALVANSAFTQVLSGGRDKNIRLDDLNTGRRLVTLEGHSRSISFLAANANFEQALSASGDKTLRRWDLQSGKCLATLKGHSEEVTAVAADPGFTQALSASRDKSLRVWDLHSGHCSATLEGHRGDVLSVAANEAFTLALSCSRDRTLRLWDLVTNECLASFEGHEDSVGTVAVDPTFTKAISGGRDRSLRLWDLNTGACLTTFIAHERRVSTVAANAGMTYAASASWDETLRLWDLSSGHCIATYHAGSPIRSMYANLDAGRIVCACADGQLHSLSVCHRHDTIRLDETVDVGGR